MTLLSSGHPDEIREQAILSLQSIPPPPTRFYIAFKAGKGKKYM